MAATTRERRLWVGIEPSIPVVDRIAVLQEELAEPLHQLGVRVQWIGPEAFRYMLRSVPFVDDAFPGLVRDAVSRIARASGPFDLQTEGTRLQPSLEIPRTVTVGAGEGSDELERLATRVDAALQAAGGPVESRPWTAELLVGRLSTPQRAVDLRGVIEGYARTRYGVTFCRELVVLVSEVVGSDVRWSTISRAELGTGA